MTTNQNHDRPSRTGLRALGEALLSWRTASVTLLSFSSGMPLGLVWISLPDFMREAGYDIRIIGMTTLAHAPWTFKVPVLASTRSIGRVRDAHPAASSIAASDRV